MATYLTKRQREILNFLTKFIKEKGYSPSLEEICKGMGLSSLATVHVHLKNLEDKNFIRHAWNRSRSIEIIEQQEDNVVSIAQNFSVVEIPLLGRVAAGRPIEAVQSEETIDVPATFVTSNECFALRVQGNSMIEDSICDGDTIIVESRKTAHNGETVVALVDDSETTVKKFYRKGKDQIRLQPANHTMEPIIIPAASCQIQGVVVGLLRQYTR